MKDLRSCLEALCAEAYAMVLGSLKVACTMLFCAFVLQIHTGSSPSDELALSKAAAVLREAPLGILLLGLLFSILLEERSRLR